MKKNKPAIPPILPAPPRSKWALPLFIALAAFVAFLPALKNGFLAWDDVDNFVNNSEFRGFGLTQLKWMFTTYHMGPYQPLSWLTSALDYSLWGMNPTGYHLTNLLLHSLNAVLFYFLGQRVLRWAFPVADDDSIGWSSAVAALFFAIHPLRVESVAWATERRDVLSGAFFLASAIYYLKRFDRPGDTAAAKENYSISLAFYILALLSKATAVGLIWGLIALDIYPLKRLSLRPRDWVTGAAWPVWREKIPFVLLGAAAVVNGMFGLSAAIGHYTPWQKIAFFLYGSVFYVQKTLWPGTLSPLYEIPFHFETLTTAIALCAGIALLATAALYSVRQRFPAGIVCWLAYLLMFLPVSGLAQNGPQIVAARYSYLACMPWALLLGGGLVVWGRKTPARLILAVGIAGLSWLTWSQTELWRDDYTLWGSAVALDPGNSRAQNNFGAALKKRGQDDAAVEHYQKALELNPYLAEAYRDMGLVLAERGKPEDAIAYYKKAEEIRAGVPEVNVNLATAYYKLGKVDEAIENFQKALELHTPHQAEVYSNLALALMMKGRTDEAIPYYQQAEKLKPEIPQVHNNLASALAKAGRRDEAIAEARWAILLSPNYGKAHMLLGTLLKERGDTVEGNEHIAAAMRLGPASR